MELTYENSSGNMTASHIGRGHFAKVESTEPSASAATAGIAETVVGAGCELQAPACDAVGITACAPALGDGLASGCVKLYKPLMN